MLVLFVLLMLLLSLLFVWSLVSHSFHGAQGGDGNYDGGRVVGRRQRSGRCEREGDGADCGGDLLIAEGGLARMMRSMSIIIDL